MNCKSHPGMMPLLLALILSFHLQGIASRCVDTVFGEDLQPLPPGVERCSFPNGILKPDVSPPGMGGNSIEGGDSRIVGGRPSAPGNYGGGSSAPHSQEDNPSQFGRPSRPWWPGNPMGPNFGNPAQGGRPRPYEPWGAAQHEGGTPERPPSGFTIRENTPNGHPRPVWKEPGIPYIPTAKEWGGTYVPASKAPPKARPNVPYGGPYGGGADSHSSDKLYDGESIASGPRGTDDGSYGPIPEALQPWREQGRDSQSPTNPCIPQC
ncbi:basic salivary proline-rich protein 3-like [Pseudonaja textilis]|uniref:basic salivary proline-rich protein 3-like n=1 Tax=Pseudonaja textilis TaxID=8673 RepID=UPI000EA9FE25|nr:basic salivary proline-rich protein 3-like [Pseudonaja textilis]